MWLLAHWDASVVGSAQLDDLGGSGRFSQQVVVRIPLPPNGAVKEEIRGGGMRQIQGYMYLASSLLCGCSIA